MINVFGRTWSTYWLMDEMHVYYLYDRDLKIVLKKIETLVLGKSILKCDSRNWEMSGYKTSTGPTLSILQQQ